MLRHFKLALFFSLILSQALTAQEISLIKTDVGENINLMVPSEFIPMGPQDIRNKFISYREPLAGFTSEDRSVDLVVNKSKTPWSNQDIALLREFNENNIRNLFDEVNFLKSEVQEINGRNYAVFEFTSVVKGDPNSLRNQASVNDYRMVLYTVDDFNVYVFTFYCPARLKQYWQTTAQSIMSSIIFK